MKNFQICSSFFKKEKVINLLVKRNSFSFLCQHVDDLNDITKKMKKTEERVPAEGRTKRPKTR